MLVLSWMKGIFIGNNYNLYSTIFCVLGVINGWSNEIMSTHFYTLVDLLVDTSGVRKLTLLARCQCLHFNQYLNMHFCKTKTFKLFMCQKLRSNKRVK